MIKHIVMWRIKDENKAENAAKMKHDLESLDEKVDVLRYIEVGINIETSNAAYDVVLVTAFDSQSDLIIYQNNPDHKSVGEFIRSIATSRVVVDYEV